MSHYHLAQINNAKARAEMDSDIMQGFVARLDEINALADTSPGFVWRLQSEDGDATSIRVFDDPLLLVNMSVWVDIDSLKNYVYRSNHVDLIRDRDAWFHKTATAHMVLWWIPAGHTPTLEEGKQKLELLDRLGPGPEAFTFAKPQPAPACS
jgi:hypothetical protein